MFIRRFQPFGHFRRITNPRTPIARGYLDYPAGNHLTRGWPIPLDVVEEDGQFMVHAAVPGVDPEDLEIAVAGGALTIEGCSNMVTEHKNGKYLVRERRFGGFRWPLRLPEWADVDNAEAPLLQRRSLFGTPETGRQGYQAAGGNRRGTGRRIAGEGVRASKPSGPCIRGASMALP